jgi:hypothetical protein
MGIKPKWKWLNFGGGGISDRSISKALNKINFTGKKRLMGIEKEMKLNGQVL